MKYLHKRQQGVVLVIGLLMLLVITMVGVTAMSGTTSNERMTANYQFQTLSFQAAESAINDVFDVPSVEPSVMANNWNVRPPANNYDVEIHSGTNMQVAAQADIQFCGELAATNSAFCQGTAPCFIEQHYDVEGEGQVAALGSQETHQRRGSRLALKLDLTWNATFCPTVP